MWLLKAFREPQSNNTSWSLTCWFRTLKVFFSCIIFLWAWAPRSTLRLSLDISVTRLAKNCHFLVSKTKSQKRPKNCYFLVSKTKLTKGLFLISKTKSHKRPPSTLAKIYITLKSFGCPLMSIILNFVNTFKQHLWFITDRPSSS